jgi:hypothetical protein
MFDPNFLVICLPTLLTGLYLLRWMKQQGDKEAKKQRIPIPVEKKKRDSEQ